MADNRKEQERAELHRTIWNISNDLRGNVSGWDFKQYVLSPLFYRCISENLTVYFNRWMAEAGFRDFDYARMPDAEAETARDDTVNTKFFFILPSELFVNVCRNATQDDNLNETLEKVFKHIEASAACKVSEASFKGLFDDVDLNSNKLGASVATRNGKLAKLLRGVQDIRLSDTLTDPQHWDDEPFQDIVSNPPYSTKWAGEDNPVFINAPRFSPAGVLTPKSKADLAFILHSLSWLSADGTAAIVCFPGVMYRGGKEGKICKYLIDNNYLNCVIQLPDNLFFGTTIATCIVVLKKGKRDNTVLFIDASAECVKATSSNKLTDANTGKILDAFINRKSEKYFARVVPSAEIEAQGYNLSVSTYVEQEDRREIIDIRQLNCQIGGIVAREAGLRTEIDKSIVEIEG